MVLWVPRENERTNERNQHGCYLQHLYFFCFFFFDTFDFFVTLFLISRHTNICDSLFRAFLCACKCVHQRSLTQIVRFSLCIFLLHERFVWFFMLVSFGLSWHLHLFSRTFFPFLSFSQSLSLLYSFIRSTSKIWMCYLWCDNLRSHLLVMLQAHRVVHVVQCSLSHIFHTHRALDLCRQQQCRQRPVYIRIFKM